VSFVFFFPAGFPHSPHIFDMKESWQDTPMKPAIVPIPSDFSGSFVKKDFAR
jgi:hypothetical protein